MLHPHCTLHITNTGTAGNVPVQPAEGGGGADCAEGGGYDDSEVMAAGHRSDIHHSVTHWNKNAMFSEPENQKVNMKSAWIWIIFLLTCIVCLSRMPQGLCSIS